MRGRGKRKEKEELGEEYDSLLAHLLMVEARHVFLAALKSITYIKRKALRGEKKVEGRDRRARIHKDGRTAALS